MFEEFERVRIVGINVIGTIIDVHKASDGTMLYTIESETEDPIDDPDAWNDVRFPQLICTVDRLEHV